VVVLPDDAASAGTATDNETSTDSDAIADLQTRRAFDTEPSIMRTALLPAVAILPPRR
jgi:hypothetical protein